MTMMLKGYPAICRNSDTLQETGPTDQSLEDQISDFVKRLEMLLPEDYKECLIYALILIERVLGKGVFLHSTTIMRYVCPPGFFSHQ